LSLAGVQDILAGVQDILAGMQDILGMFSASGTICYHHTS
jgi:hypothetical protein